MKTSIQCASAALVAALLPAAAAGQFRPTTPEPPPGPPSTWLPVETRWTATLPAPASAPPVASGDRLFAALFDGRVAAVSLVDGSELWQVERAVVGEIAAGGGLLHAATPAGLLALDAETGAVRWETGLEPRVSAPLLLTAGWLIVALETDELLALHAGLGGTVWRQPVPGGISTRPTIAGDRLYVPLDSGGIAVLELLTGALVWERRLGGAPREILVSGDLFVGATDNFFYKLSPRDGALRWRWRAGGDIAGLPAVDEETVYFSSLDNTLWALDRSSGGQRWRELLPARPAAGPRRAEDLIMQGGLSPELSLYGPASGVVYHRLRVSAELAFAPLPVRDPLGDGLLVILVTADGELQAVGRASEPVRLDPAAATVWERLLPAVEDGDASDEGDEGDDTAGPPPGEDAAEPAPEEDAAEPAPEEDAAEPAPEEDAAEPVPEEDAAEPAPEEEPDTAEPPPEDAGAPPPDDPNQEPVP